MAGRGPSPPAREDWGAARETCTATVSGGKICKYEVDAIASMVFFYGLFITVINFLQ